MYLRIKGVPLISRWSTSSKECSSRIQPNKTELKAVKRSNKIKIKMSLKNSTILKMIILKVPPDLGQIKVMTTKLALLDLEKMVLLKNGINFKIQRAIEF